jgi:hypothetical protein
VTGQILVPLRRNDKIEDVVPYLEQIARPGSRVILLIHYSVEGLDWLQSKLAVSVIEEEKLVAKKNTFLALEPLRQRDVTVALDIYAGPAQEGRKAVYAQGRYRSGHDWRQRQVVDRKAFPELSTLSQLLVRKQICFRAPLASGYF